MSEKQSNRILGLSFISCASAVVIVMAGKMQPYLVRDEVTREAVRGWVEAPLQGSKKEKVFIVQGVGNLKKLGPKPLDVHVVVVDVPEMLAYFPREIRMGDTKALPDGTFDKVMISDAEHVLARIKWSRYSTPINPKRIVEARATFVVALPNNTTKRFEPVIAIDSILDRVRGSYRGEVETGIYEFLAGLIGRKEFGTIRRRSLLKLIDKEAAAVEDYKVAFSTLQRWLESEDEGRLVSTAYQMCAKHREITAPIAVTRTECDMELLLALMRNIPPSRRQSFEGWKAPKEVA